MLRHRRGGEHRRRYLWTAPFGIGVRFARRVPLADLESLRRTRAAPCLVNASCAQPGSGERSREGADVASKVRHGTVLTPVRAPPYTVARWPRSSRVVVAVLRPSDANRNLFVVDRLKRRRLCRPAPDLIPRVLVTRRRLFDDFDVIGLPTRLPVRRVESFDCRCGWNSLR